MTGVELLLAGVLVLTNVFWATQCQVLLNKLMSRNYNEFKVADLQGKEKPKKIEKQGFPALDDMGQLTELM